MFFDEMLGSLIREVIHILYKRIHTYSIIEYYLLARGREAQRNEILFFDE